MSKFALWIICICLCFSTGYVFAQDVVTVRVAKFSPNYFKDNTGNWTGLSVELASAIIKTAGFEPNFIELPWSRAIVHLKDGELHYMTNLAKTEERSKFLYWIGPLRVDKSGLIVRRENVSLRITALDDFITVCHNKKKRFGIQQDVWYSDKFTQRLNDDPEFQSCFEIVSNVESNLKKTVRHRILGFFESIPGMRYRIVTDPKYAALAIHPFVVSTDTGEVFHGLSKQGTSPEMLNRLQKGYKHCIENGTIQRIVERWNAE